MALFKTKAEKKKERAAAIEKKVTQLQKPPSKLDKAGRDLLPQSQRVRWGYRGHDPSREPAVDIDTKQRASQIKRSLGVTPEELTRRVTEAKKKKAKGK